MPAKAKQTAAIIAVTGIVITQATMMFTAIPHLIAVVLGGADADNGAGDRVRGRH